MKQGKLHLPRISHLDSWELKHRVGFVTKSVFLLSPSGCLLPEARKRVTWPSGVTGPSGLENRNSPLASVRDEEQTAEPDGTLLSPLPGGEGDKEGQAGSWGNCRDYGLLRKHVLNSLTNSALLPTNPRGSDKCQQQYKSIHCSRSFWHKLERETLLFICWFAWGFCNVSVLQ